MQYLLSSTLFSGFGGLVRSLGGDPESLLAAYQLPTDIESKTDTYVPFSNAALLFEHCADHLQCPDFGLRLSQLQGLSILGPVAVLARNASNLEAAIHGISDYLHLITPAIEVRFDMVAKERCLRATFTILEQGLFRSGQLHELLIGNGQLIVQMLIGTNVHAQRMYFPHSRIAPRAVYRKLFQCEVRFNQDECAVDLPLSIMQRRPVGADRETARIASAYLAEHFGGYSGHLQEQVKHLIRRLLPTGHCKIGVIAEQLGLHPRTLQRRLNEEGYIFDNLVDETRRVLAQNYLAQSRLRLTQVAGLLGYADQSALNRSCRRWFDQTPREIRKIYSQSEEKAQQAR